jgi:ubiquinone/menaquinone biosynthesis C-methylase UbiE
VGGPGQLWEAAAHEWAAHVRGGGDKQFEWNAPPFFDSLPPPRGLAVEIGCGEGRVARELRARGYEVVAFDVSETLVTLAREADPDGQYAVADAATLPIGDGAAELVVAFNVLHEIPHLRQAVAEAARVLAPGGRFCFANVHPVATAGDFAADSDDFVLSSYCESFARSRPVGAAEITHFHRPLSEYTSALTAAGFLVEAVGEVPTVRRAPGRIPAYLHVRAVKAMPL